MQKRVDTVRTKWSLRYRNTEDPTGAQWDSYGDIYPIEWTVTRQLGQPATAQIVLPPQTLVDTYEVYAIIEGLVHGHNRDTVGISCFREDYPEGEDNENEAVFFGILTLVDIPSEGPITIQAKDFTSLLGEYTVDDIEFVNEPGIRALSGLAGAYTAKHPKADGFVFKEVGSLPPLTAKYEAKDLVTVADAVDDYLAQYPDIYIWHLKGVEIMVGRPTDYESGTYVVEKPLATSSVTRQLGPGLNANIFRVAADGFDGQRTIEDIVTPRKYNQSESSTIVQLRGGITDALKESIRERGNNPTISASVEELWTRDRSFPLVGQQIQVQLPTTLPSFYGNARKIVEVTGTLRSMTITPYTINYEIDKNTLV